MKPNIEDPRGREPRPPFPPQEQRPPGLECDSLLHYAATKAAIANFLASTGASYVTGMIYGATGGDPLC